MKTMHIFAKGMLILLAALPVMFLQGCKKDNDPENTKSPVWVYDTGEDPSGSKPCISGSNVVFCTMPRDNGGTIHTGTYCLDKNSGSLTWKVSDTITGMATSPLIYNNLILKGGLNPHAVRLSDGGADWLFRDDTIHISMYSSPMLVGDAAYFACPFHMVKLHAGTGSVTWKTNGFYNNLRLARPAYRNSRVFYCDASYYKLTSFYDVGGQVDWAVTFPNAFANTPFITDEEAFVGIQESDINTATLRCLRLSDQSEKWAVKLGVIFSDVILADGRVYAVGQNTLHCRSAADGSAIWQYSMVAGAASEPLVASNKLFLGYGAGLLCLDATTGSVLWDYRTPDENQFFSPALDGSRIYVSCSDGKVYCFDVNE